MGDVKQDRQQADDPNGPGDNNGIPEDAGEGESTGLPDSEREKSETAGKHDA